MGVVGIVDMMIMVMNVMLSSSDDHHSMSYLHHHLQHTRYQLYKGQFRVWDVRAMENVHTLSGHTASISAIHFSENGYIAATGDL